MPSAEFDLQAAPPGAALNSPVGKRVYLVILLEAAARAGLTPISASRLHLLAYFTDLLSSVGDLRSVEGKVLKQRGGPFYPTFQHELDSLVGCGVAKATNIQYAQTADHGLRISCMYETGPFADRIIGAIHHHSSVRARLHYTTEVALAASGIPPEHLDISTLEDATYADPMTAFGDVVDFDEWQRRNFSAAAARTLARLVPGVPLATAAEQLHLYLRHIHARLESHAA